MILEIDAGNTRLKWRLLGDRQQVSVRGSQDYSAGLALLTAQLEAEVVSLVRIANVAGGAVGSQLKQWAHDDLGAEVVFARTLRCYAGISIAYDDPSRLGVDRWLAMLAAHGKGGEHVCVIDAGSAITVDLLTKEGRHLGGYIVPGPKMLRKSLLADTGQIVMSSQDQSNQLIWGKGTDEAVNHGIYRMAVSFLQSITDELSGDGRCWSLHVAGGDGAMLMSNVSTEFVVTYDPDLVFKGLAIALPCTATNAHSILSS